MIGFELTIRTVSASDLPLRAWFKRKNPEPTRLLKRTSSGFLCLCSLDLNWLTKLLVHMSLFLRDSIKTEPCFDQTFKLFGLGWHVLLGLGSVHRLYLMSIVCIGQFTLCFTGVVEFL